MASNGVAQQSAGAVRGKEATVGNIDAALALASQLQSTFGPRGRDKLFMDAEGRITVTNDGATILQLLKPGHPVAQMMVQVGAAMDAQVGDGTTTVTLLCAALLRHAKRLFELGFATNVIAKGYRMALAQVEKQLDKGHMVFSKGDWKTLHHLVSVPLYSKILSHERDFFADLVIS